MNTLTHWQDVYAELESFVSNHPEVEIKPEKISLPNEYRPDFYRLFDLTRIAFVEEFFSVSMREAAVLSRHYLKAEHDVIKMLELDSISVPISVRRFMNNPVNECMRGLFDILFDLLLGRINSDIFKEKALKIISASYEPLYQAGYEKWVVLSLLILLDADKVFRSPVKDITMYDVQKRGGVVEEEIPAPKETKTIVFNDEPECCFVMPDVLVHSSRLDKYIAIRSQIVRTLGISTKLSQAREWCARSLLVFDDLILIYVADQLEDVSLVADMQKICRPDLILYCKGRKPWTKTEELKLAGDSLKPTSGAITIYGEFAEDREQDGDALMAGFEQPRLDIVIERMRGTGHKESQSL